MPTLGYFLIGCIVGVISGMCITVLLISLCVTAHDADTDPDYYPTHRP